MTGTDRECVRRELQEAGFPGFGFDAGETAVPGLSGEWVIGEVEHEGGAATRGTIVVDPSVRHPTGK